MPELRMRQLGQPVSVQSSVPSDGVQQQPHLGLDDRLMMTSQAIRLCRPIAVPITDRRTSHLIFSNSFSIFRSHRKSSMCPRTTQLKGKRPDADGQRAKHTLGHLLAVGELPIHRPAHDPTHTLMHARPLSAVTLLAITSGMPGVVGVHLELLLEAGPPIRVQLSSQQKAPEYRRTHEPPGHRQDRDRRHHPRGSQEEHEDQRSYRLHRSGCFPLPPVLSPPRRAPVTLLTPAIATRGGPSYHSPKTITKGIHMAGPPRILDTHAVSTAARRQRSRAASHVRQRHQPACLELYLHQQAREGSYVLAAVGELDLASGPKLRDRVAALCDAGARALLLDLTELAFLDLGGLRSVLAGHALCRERHCQLTCQIADHGPVHRLLELIGALDGHTGDHELDIPEVRVIRPPA